MQELRGTLIDATPRIGKLHDLEATTVEVELDDGRVITAELSSAVTYDVQRLGSAAIITTIGLIDPIKPTSYDYCPPVHTHRFNGFWGYGTELHLEVDDKGIVREMGEAAVYNHCMSVLEIHARNQ